MSLVLPRAWSHELAKSLITCAWSHELNFAKNVITWACQELDHMSLILPRTWSHEFAKSLITWAIPKGMYMWSATFISQFRFSTKRYNSQLNMNVSSSSIPEFLTNFSLQVVFLIIDITILGVLLFFKMYRKFIYRLLLYAFIAWIISSISWTTYILTIIKVQGQQVEIGTFTNSSISIIFVYIYLSSHFFLSPTNQYEFMHVYFGYPPSPVHIMGGWPHLPACVLNPLSNNCDWFPGYHTSICHTNLQRLLPTTLVGWYLGMTRK